MVKRRTIQIILLLATAELAIGTALLAAGGNPLHALTWLESACLTALAPMARISVRRERKRV